MVEESEMKLQTGKAATNFEARSSKSETNSNDKKFNVLNKSKAKTLLRVSVVLVAFAVGFSACAGKSASSKFYVLSPLAQSKLSGPETRTIGVFPVAMPDYLSRPQIVTRVSENEIKFDEFNRWAAPLKEHFYTVLVENLGTLLAPEKIVKTTHNLGAQLALQVGLEVVQFDGTLGGDVVLIVNWALLEVDGKKPPTIKRSLFKEPTGAATYEALVAAESSAIAALSREIAETVRDRK
jgi:uncharacterized lipoprotein YmbA